MLTPQEEAKRDALIIALLDEQINHLQKINQGIMRDGSLTESHIKVVNQNIAQMITLLKVAEDYA
jgi:acyl-ACP thioesterase